MAGKTEFDFNIIRNTQNIMFCVNENIKERFNYEFEPYRLQSGDDTAAERIKSIFFK